VAAFVGARPEDLVFVQNVTTGLNAVLASVPLGYGDEVLITDLAYGAVVLAAQHACESRHATLRTVSIAYPVVDRGDVVEAIVKALTPRTMLVIIDDCTAQTALLLPVMAIAAECRRRGVPVLVDGAHVPGTRPLDIEALGVDFYAANLHKWAHAPRACGFLWVPPRWQPAMHAPIVSWGHNHGYREEFEHTPTIDPTNYLAAPEGLALLREWGFAACVAYQQELAWNAGQLLSDCWRTPFATPRSMVGTMVTVALPETLGSTSADADRLRLALLVDDHIEVHLFAWRGRLWTRVSAQVYNEPGDVERLAEVISRKS
jgi:isopenicillin-N epimerase